MPWIEITMSFGSQKLAWIDIQHTYSSNSNHSKTNFPLTTSYFLAHYFGTRVMILLVPTLERRKKCIPSFGWKSLPTLIGNRCRLGMDLWLGMGGFTIKSKKSMVATMLSCYWWWKWMYWQQGHEQRLQIGQLGSILILFKVDVPNTNCWPNTTQM